MMGRELSRGPRRPAPVEPSTAAPAGKGQVLYAASRRPRRHWPLRQRLLWLLAAAGGVALVGAYLGSGRTQAVDERAATTPAATPTPDLVGGHEAVIQAWQVERGNTDELSDVGRPAGEARPLPPAGTPTDVTAGR